MHRFKSSKYKNGVAKVPKKELCITDVSVEAPVSYGNHVSCGAKFFVCNLGGAGGGKLGVFGVDDCGRKGQHPMLAAHAGIITDIEFSPFYHDTFLSASDDSTVKIWKIPDSGVMNSGSYSPASVFKGFKKRPEVLQHHPVAESLCALATGGEIKLLNMKQEDVALNCEVCSDTLQSIAWSYDGKTIAATSKNKKLFIADPRVGQQVVETAAHGNHKDSRVICLGDSEKFATTGFTTSRSRELKAWDPRNLTSCLQTIEFGTSTGVLMPFYDADAKLIFLAGKGDSSLSILEVVDGTELISQASQTMLPDQSKGMGILPKLAVDVMSCEVDRLMQLCARQIVPVKIEVPRKSHRDFISELYPDTDSDEIVLTAENWLSGTNGQRTKTSLDPSTRKSLRVSQNAPTVAAPAAPAEPTEPVEPVEPAESAAQAAPAAEVVKNTTPTDTKKVASSSPPPPSESKLPAPEKKVEVEKPKPTATAVVAKPFAGVRQSKFRHWTGTVLHPTTHITNIPKLNTSLSGSCDGFHINTERVAFPLSTPGGHVAIWELSKIGRLPSSDPPSLQNTAAVTDMRWDPFNSHRIAVGLENGKIKVWEIPEGGLKEVVSEESFSLSGHYNKVICVRFHPLASGILASASSDSTIKIWDLESQENCITLTGHEDEILNISWSSDGKYIASMCKDNKIRIYDPRSSTEPIKVATGSEGSSRGGRIVWACSDQLLISSGFKSGAREIAVYDVTDMDRGQVESQDLGGSPSTLIPHYDEDSSTLFVTGKGDTTMHSFEVSPTEPHLHQLNTFTSDKMHQGFLFLPKTTCDPRKVEFARAWRLSKTTLVPISFKVPRIKMEYFQDDLFPETRDLRKPTMTSQQWLDGKNVQASKISVCPKDMKPLSEAPKEAPKARKYESYDPSTYKTDEEKKEELLAAMSNRLDLDKELEQDTMEGVDEDEWDDY
uniref:coronin-7-like n=1 Tax=Ciona intestinalis TaxID=7719 RepID=UPI000180CEC9|nr:coronin-7-like [Ciona intestinalis]|eukprot:XP_002128072.1 coronin-7-like [Ciona intestinalis]